MTHDPSIIAASTDHRRQQRTHLYVAATLYAESGSSPVRIRNLSASGVLIEAAVIPAPGARIILKRGSLEAAGTVAWSLERRAGLAFDAAIQVTDWMSRTLGNHQERVDQILTSVRTEDQGAGAKTAVPFPVAAQHSIESELLQLQLDLGQLASGLSEDSAVVAAHPEIQLLDISVQRIGRILAGLKRAA